jgi:hypothetical protein
MISFTFLMISSRSVRVMGHRDESLLAEECNRHNTCAIMAPTSFVSTLQHACLLLYDLGGILALFFFRLATFLQYILNQWDMWFRIKAYDYWASWG